MASRWIDCEIAPFHHDVGLDGPRPIFPHNRRSAGRAELACVGDWFPLPVFVRVNRRFFGKSSHRDGIPRLSRVFDPLRVIVVGIVAATNHGRVASGDDQQP